MPATIDKLVEDLDRAIAPANCCEAAVCGTCTVLKNYADTSFNLPERLLQQADGCYARHLVYQKEGDGFVVVAMVWAPGQGTAVHDHGGVWCVEGCVRGRLEITSYRLLKGDGDEVRFQQEGSVQVGPGKIGCLIPPFEHHRIHNPFPETAVTLHVYGKELRNCTRYVEVGPGTYRPESVSLCYTSRP